MRRKTTVMMLVTAALILASAGTAAAQDWPPALPVAPGQNVVMFQQGFLPWNGYDGAAEFVAAGDEDPAQQYLYFTFQADALPAGAAVVAAQLAVYQTIPLDATGAPGWLALDVTAGVQAWADGPRDQAFVYALPVEADAAPFLLSDAPAAYRRPRLTVIFAVTDRQHCAPATIPDAAPLPTPPTESSKPPGRPAPLRQDEPPTGWPDTTDGVHVFNDQINVENLSDAQVAFAATHFDGAQKTTRTGTDMLRAYNPDFIALHYRLGLGLGYRQADDGCQPTGGYLHHLSGDEWVQGWPGDEGMPEAWFYHIGGERAYWCTWGWYLMNTEHPGWLNWWLGGVLSEIEAGAYDGLFADSVTVPNYLDADTWNPELPGYDEAFEAEWTRRLEDWMRWTNGALEPYTLIVNAGQLVTTREQTDYSFADGVMVEGFAGWDEYERFAFEDWQIQMDRTLALVRQGRIVILQSYIEDPAERLWMLANYLLLKGDRTYINIEYSEEAEWFPEYDLPIGAPMEPPAASVADLAFTSGVYARAYTGGLVMVNPDPDGALAAVSLDLPMYLVTGVTGGGEIPEDADLSAWGIETAEVSEFTVAPGQAAILLHAPPGEVAAAEPMPTAQPTAQPVAAPPVEGLEAFHRSGQTFLTWAEANPNDLSITYRVYRHTAPIEAGALDAATLLAELPQGSGAYWTERARATEDEMWAAGGDYRSLRNYVITDLGSELPDGTGLFVWTTQEAAPGDYYYAVAGSAPNSNELALWATAGPVTEQAADPAPVLVWQSEDGRSNVYTQFMDYASYNPTYDAPNASNYYLSLPEWETLEQTQNQQYAYNYWVGQADPAICGGAVPDQVPLVLHIEGWGSRYNTPPASEYWCVVTIWGDDPNQSWYFGFSAAHDYNTGLPVTQGPIVNYTEVRLLRAMREVLASVNEPQIDTNRIYVYGHSMGGTGALMMAERYPGIFAAASASEPMMNFAASEVFVEELEAKWGAVELNLPVESRGPDAAHLAAYDGTGVWDWENLGAQLSARRGGEMAFISVAHGTDDRVIDWETVARPAYTHFYEGARGFVGEIVMADHTWVGFRYYDNFLFDAFNFRKDESFPALSRASGSLPTPPDGPGGYNLTLEWSASWHDFAGPPVDEPGAWSVALRSLDGEQTVDVTPRRLQAFEVTPGAAYTWRNERLDDGAIIQEGELSADADGLLTVPGFTVTEAGNRLVIEQ